MARIDARALGDEPDVEALKWSFLVGVGSGGLYSVGGSAANALLSRGTKAARDAANIEKAKRLRQDIEETTRRISEAKTATRIPEKMEDFVREATDGTIDKVYIDGKALAEFAQIADKEGIAAMQAELGAADENADAETRQRIEDFSRKLAEELGIEDIGAYFEALATGTDVEIDAARLLTKIGTDENYAFLKDHIKLSPTEMSAFEAQQAEAEMAEKVRQLREMAEEETERERAAGDAIAAIARDIRKQLAAVGRADLFGKGGAGAGRVGDLLTARIVRKAADMGVSVEELARPGAVRVETDGETVRIRLVRQDGAAYSGGPKRGEEAAQGFEQAMNPGVNPDAAVNFVRLPGAEGRPDRHAMMEQLQKLVEASPFISYDNLGKLSLGSGKKRRHLIQSRQNIGALKGEIQSARTLSVLSIDELVKQSVLIESGENKKKDEKPNVEAYHRFYVPVLFGDKTYVVRIVAEEQKGKAGLFPIEADLYDVMVEKEGSSSPLPSPRNEAGIVGGTEEPNNITIRKMLENVNDMEGNQYFNADGSFSEPSAWQDRRFAAVADDNADGARETFAQPLNADVDLEQRVPVLDATAVLPTAAAADKNTLLAHLKGIIGQEFSTLNNDALVKIVGNVGHGKTRKDRARHIVFSKAGEQSDARIPRNAGILSLEKLISNAVMVESIPNRKGDKKPDVEMYHRFYVPVRVGDNLYTLRLVAEEMRGRLNLAPQETVLYDVAVDKKAPLQAFQPPSPEGHGNMRGEGFEKPNLSSAIPQKGNATDQAGFNKISIRDMLAGVKDADGADYVGGPDLYDMAVDKEIPLPTVPSSAAVSGRDTARGRDNTSPPPSGSAIMDETPAEAQSEAHEISIRDMLAGVKDADGADYVGGPETHNQSAQGGGNPETFYQPLNADVDLEQRVPVFDATSVLPSGEIADKNALLKHLKELTGLEISTLDNEKIVKILGKIPGDKGRVDKARHVVYGPGAIFSRFQEIRNTGVLSVENLIANSVLIESTENRKKDKKGNVEAYHRFYVPMRVGDDVYTIRLVAEEIDGKLGFKPDETVLYDMAVDKKMSPPAQPELVAEDGVTQEEASLQVTIRDMLAGVKDADGADYVGGPETHNQSAQGGGNPETFYQTAGAEAALAADEAAWGKAVDEVISGKVKPLENIKVMTTPLALHLAGADVLPVYMSAGKVRQVMKEHGLDAGLMKQVPFALADPIAIFKSETQPHGLVIMTELKDANGATVMAAFHLNATQERGGYVVNKLASVYGKDKEKSLAGTGRSGLQLPSGAAQQDSLKEKIPNDQWFVKQAQSGQLKYVNTKKADAWSGQTRPLLLPVGSDKHQLHADNIKTEDDLVNLQAEYPTLYQTPEGGDDVKGSVSFTQTEAIIDLFAFADRSTMLHELGHVFLQDIRDVAGTPGARESGVSLWRDVAEWLGISDIDFSGPLSEADRARWKTAQEKWAASFEAYLMEGKAPTPALQRAFRAFKKWLADVYRTVAGIRYLDAEGNWQRVALSDQARALFDRVLASDEAIENEAVMNDMAADGPSMEALRTTADESVPAEVFETLDDAQYEAIEAAKERLLADMLEETTPEKRARIQRRVDELKPFVRSIVEREPVYRAIADMQADAALRLSLEEILDGFGDTTVAALPENVEAEGGVPLEAAAAAYGFASAREMIEGMTAALPLEVEVERRAIEQALRDEGAATASPESVASRAEDALYEGDEALDKTLIEAEILRNMEDSELEREAAEAEAERDNPLNRQNVVKFIKGQGGLSFKKVKGGYGRMEAQELAERTGGALWRKGLLGLDEAVQLLQAEGIPVRDEGHLAQILTSEDAPLLSSLDREYQKGFLDGRQAKRRAWNQAKNDEKQRREWLLLNRERLKGLREELKTAAEGVIGAKESDKAVDPKPYIRAAARAKAEAERAMKKKNWTAAAAAKDRQAVNEACARAAIRAGKEQDRILHFLRKFANRPHKQSFGVAPAYLAQIDAIMDRFDLRKKTPTEQQIPVKSLAKFVEELQAAGEPVLIPEEILDANYRKSYRKMSMDELRALNDAVKNIERLGRWEGKFIGQQRNVRIDTAAAQIARIMTDYFRLRGPSAMDPAGEEARGFFEKLKRAPEEFLASIEMVEFLTRAMDGYGDLGPAHQYIFQPIRDALTRETELLNGTFAKLNDLVREIYGTDKPGFKREKIELNIRMRDTQGNVIQGRNWALTKDQVIAAVLNMGNAGNRQRLMDGWGLTDSEARELTGALTEKDLRFVQGIWDLFEGLRPTVKETAELMTGVTPAWVEPTPLVTKYGTLRGGYYPIVTDARYSMRAAQQEEMADLMGTVNMDYLSASTRSGHRKERADSVAGRPPLLSLSVVDRHLIGVIHDACLAPAVRDVNKLIHHQAVRDAIKQALGDHQNRVLNHWLRAVAGNNKNNGVVMDAADRGLGRLQTGVAAMGLGANISGALLQVTGYLPLAARIGPLRAVRALLRGMAAPRETARFVLEKSAFMREQLKGQDRDLRRMAEKWTIEGKGKLDAFRSFTLSHYSVCQNLCSIPGWLECYKLGLKKFGGDDAQAVKYADSVIRQTQGAGTVADLTEQLETIPQIV